MRFNIVIIRNRHISFNLSLFIGSAIVPRGSRHGPADALSAQFN
jgi:hypothetical protein